MEIKQELNKINKVNINDIKHYILVVVASLFISFLITQFVRPVNVEGRSMEKTLKNNDKLILDMRAYKTEAPKYKDIVVIDAGDNFDVKYIIKRVIGVPGDKIDIVGSEVKINGVVLDEPYINKDEVPYGDYDIHLTLSDEEIFVMGDNRNHSMDSRSQRVGAINYKDNVKGKILCRVYPFEKLPQY